VIQWSEKRVPVASLRPYERNPRKISEVAFARLKASIQEMGYHQRIVAQPDLRVIGGHQRIKALQELGIETVSVLIPDRELTRDEFRRLLVQDNLPFGEFNWEMLQTDFGLGELADWGMPAEWLANATPPFDDAKADETPALEAKAVSAPRDVWLLGAHRVMCGDSTSKSDVESLLGGAKPNLMVTDPPYGVNYDATARRSLQSANCNPAHGIVSNDDNADWTLAWRLFSGNVAYVWHAGNKAAIVAKSLENIGLEIRAQIVWGKTKFVIGRGHYHGQHESCWYAVRENGNWQGSRNESTLWTIDHRKSETGHSTQKPIECMRRPILNNSAEGDAVYDPFLGSGTTLIAAEQTNRKCFGMEISPAYVDVIVRRWQTFVGKSAILDGDGRTFAEIEKSRG
jgi:DNA modification methylase